ncbi:MAG: hypothetical protein WCR21_00870 [Bacteroidota bacterium]
MKKIILSIGFISLMSCGGADATKEAPKVVCDTVEVALYDSTGAEIKVATVKCDTIKEAK